jgi:hypothetical protein
MLKNNYCLVSISAVMIISVAAVAHGQNAAGVSSPPNIIEISSDEQAWNYYVVELYDLTADPLETRNTATAHANIVASIRHKADAW